MNDDSTIAVYDAKAADYAGLTATLGELRELEAFAAALPAGACVLDLGCGPGFYAAWLAERGFAAEAWDASAEMVALAAAQPGVTARQARFDALAAEAAYDGIWANFSLLHVPKADLPAHLGRIRRALRGPKLFHIGMKLGAGEGPDAIGRFYAYYSEDALVRLLGAAGFTIARRWRGRGAGLSGEVSDYITLQAHG